jgi:opacity protein-like surface antigen
MQSKRYPQVLFGLFLATSVAAVQAEERPWYVTVDAGLNNASDPTFAGGRLATRQGVAYGGAVGRHLGPNWRVEAAVAYRNNPVRRVGSPGFDPEPKDADWASLFLTVNALYDFDGFQLGEAKVRPYVGLGFGRAQEVDTDLRVAGVEREYSGSGSARQLMAGLRWNYGSPWVADVGVTLADAGTVRFKATGSAASFDARYRTTSVVARLGYRF